MVNVDAYDFNAAVATIEYGPFHDFQQFQDTFDQLSEWCEFASAEVGEEVCILHSEWIGTFPEWQLRIWIAEKWKLAGVLMDGHYVEQW